MQFTCPKCGLHKLEEVMENCFVSTIIHAVEESEIEYDESPTVHDGIPIRFQCNGCGYVLPCAATAESLFKYLS